MRIFTVIALVAAITSPAAATAPPTPLMPSGPWNVEFADSMCLLSRPFGADGRSLILKPAMLSDDFEVVVTEPVRKRSYTTLDLGTAGRRVEPTKPRRPVGQTAFGPAVVAVAGKIILPAARFTAYDTAKLRLLRLQVEAANASLATLQGVMSIEAKGETPHHFTIYGIKRALPILTQCVDQLRDLYKVGKSDLAGIATMPVRPVLPLFSADDYPAEALKTGDYGTVGVLLWVETDGKVSTCEIIEAGAAVSLQMATCSILKRRSRYVPAIGIGGKAVRAPYFYRINWYLPD